MSASERVPCQSALSVLRIEQRRTDHVDDLWGSSCWLFRRDIKYNQLTIHRTLWSFTLLRSRHRHLLTYLLKKTEQYCNFKNTPYKMNTLTKRPMRDENETQNKTIWYVSHSRGKCGDCHHCRRCLAADRNYSLCLQQDWTASCRHTTPSKHVTWWE